MAFAVTLGELVTACQQLANQPGSEQLDASEWKAHISTRYGRLHTTVADTGCRYFETQETLNLASLALPSDHKMTIGVDFYDGSGRLVRELPELMLFERGLFSGQTGEARAWSFSGTNIQLYPVPTTGTYKHIYVPQPARYNASADTTSIDLITNDGYEALIWGVASIGLHRSESAQQRAVSEADAALARLREWAVLRALTMPARSTVTDINNNGFGRAIDGVWNPASWRFR